MDDGVAGTEKGAGGVEGKKEEIQITKKSLELTNLS